MLSWKQYACILKTILLAKNTAIGVKCLNKSKRLPFMNDVNTAGLDAENTHKFDEPAAEGAYKKKAEKFDLDAFDIQALEQSASLLKEELVIAVDEYLEDAVAYICDIREGLASGDAEKAARGAHPLKSNSKGFGLTAVSQLAEAINEQTRAGQTESADELLSQLQDAFHRAEKKLREFIKSTRC